MNETVSILIAVYNVEPFLDACIQSAVQQTYPHLDIVLVDDGSTDASGRICDAWKEKDDRIRVFHQANGGVSSAKNRAVAEARGAYLAFLDSDDTYGPDFIEKLMAAMTPRVDAVMGQMLVMDAAMQQVHSAFAVGEGQIDSNEALRRLVKLDRMYNCLGDKLYRRRVFENITFPLGRIFEDCARMYRIVENCRSIAYAPEAKYYYRIREGSITQQPYRLAEMDLLEQWADRLQYFREHHPGQLADASLTYLAELVVAWRRFAENASPGDREEIRSRILACYRLWRAMPVDTREMNIGQKLFFFLGKISLPMTVRMLNLVHYEFQDVM